MKSKARFEVGKTYYTRSICDNDCIIRGKVLKRTAAVKPWGTYSMALTLTADRVLSA